MDVCRYFEITLRRRIYFWTPPKYFDNTRQLHVVGGLEEEDESEGLAVLLLLLLELSSTSKAEADMTNGGPSDEATSMLTDVSSLGLMLLLPFGSS